MKSVQILIGINGGKATLKSKQKAYLLGKSTSIVQSSRVTTLNLGIIDD